MNASAAGHELLTIEDFFEGSAQGLVLFRAVAALVAAIGPSEVRVTRSQVAFRRRRGFASVWRPGRYIRSDVPVVLSIALPREIASPRFKQVVHPSPGTWMHHFELRDATQLNDEVCGWLVEAWHAAGVVPERGTE